MLFHPRLHKDGRTLLGTQSHVATTEMQGGEYFHFGLVQGILSRLKCLSLPVNLTTFTLQFNIDGLPLFKSSGLQFWPILAILKCDYTKSPFIVCIFCGLSKPKCVVEYLQQFVSDLKNVLANGIIHNGKPLNVEVSSFVCDYLPEPMLRMSSHIMGIQHVTSVMKRVCGGTKLHILKQMSD